MQEKSILQEVVEDFLEDLLNKAIAEVTGVAVTFDTGYQSTTAAKNTLAAAKQAAEIAKEYMCDGLNRLAHCLSSALLPLRCCFLFRPGRVRQAMPPEAQCHEGHTRLTRTRGP